jgi:hypothetical protein
MLASPACYGQYFRPGLSVHFFPNITLIFNIKTIVNLTGNGSTTSFIKDLNHAMIGNFYEVTYLNLSLKWHVISTIRIMTL